MNGIPASANYDLGSHSGAFWENTEVPDDVIGGKRTNHLGTCDKWGVVCNRCPFETCVKPNWSGKPPKRSKCPIDVSLRQGIILPALTLFFADEFGLLDVCECGRAIDSGRCYYCEPIIRR